MAGFRFVTITGSVGRGGRNLHVDVEHVQELLNTCPAGPGDRLLVDGCCGPKTISVIEATERRFLHAAHPDGRLDPHGPTLRALNSSMRDTSHGVAAHSPRPVSAGAAIRPPAHLESVQNDRVTPALAAALDGPAVGSRPNEITPAAGAAAQAAQRRWGVPASVTLAQYIIESNAGHHMPRGSNNPFGIKAGRNQPFVMAWTYEYLRNGTRIHVLAPFRRFSSVAEAFDAHGALLARHPAYASARSHLDDPNAYARALEGHYSTTVGYGNTIVARMRDHDLYRWNVGR